jgi:hypothetical protein
VRSRRPGGWASATACDAPRAPVRRDYPIAVWDVPTRDPGTARAGWRRKFRCPRCATSAGRQIVRPIVEPRGFAIIGYRVDRVELPYFMRRLPSLADGTGSFGYSERLWRSGDASRSAVRHHTPVLGPSADPNRVGRHSQRRFRGRMGFWSVASDGEEAHRPFVVTCQNRSCRLRFLVDSTPIPEVMAKVRDTRRTNAVLP